MTSVPWPVTVGGWVIGIIALGLAWRQSQTSREQLRYQLFDKRVAIYHDVVDQMRLIVQRGDCNDEIIVNLHAIIRKATFLFGKDVLDHLNTQVNKGLELLMANKVLDGEQQQEVRKAQAKKRTEIVRWFHDDLGRISDLFEPYVGFSHRRPERNLDMQKFRLTCSEFVTRIWSFLKNRML